MLKNTSHWRQKPGNMMQTTNDNRRVETGREPKENTSKQNIKDMRAVMLYVRLLQNVDTGDSFH